MLAEPDAIEGSLIMQKQDLMKLKEVAEMFRCSERHLQSLRKREGFPNAISLGDSTVRFLRKDIETFLYSGGFRKEAQ